MDMRMLTPWGRKNLPAQKQEQNPAYALQRDINNLFNEFFRGLDYTPWSSAEEDVFGDYVPRLDMHETDKEIAVSVELPGMEEKDISLSLSKDLLTISGEKKSEREENAKGFHKLERTYGMFRRSVVLPVEVKAEACEAVFKNGVLTVTMPKTAESEKNSKSIPIKKG